MADSKYSLDNLIIFLNNNFTLLIIVLAVFVGGFVSGSLWKETQVNQQDQAAQPEVKAGQDQPQRPSEPTQETMKNLPPVNEADHQLGAAEPKLTIVEYSNFLCGHCNNFQSTMTQLIEEYGQQIKWVYRHFAFNTGSQNLAALTECVGKYGGEDKFWQFSDELHQAISEDSSNAQLENAYQLAAKVGVNQSTVKNCVESGEFQQKVEQQAQGGKAAGATGTPNSFIITDDGQYHFVRGALPFSMLQSTIEELL